MRPGQEAPENQVRDIQPACIYWASMRPGQEAPENQATLTVATNNILLQ